MVCITEYIGRIMKGSRIWVIATMVPNWLLIITRRASSATRPIQTRTSLMTPCCCSITFQAEVRTRSEVQNGSSTRIISRLAVARWQVGQDPGHRIPKYDTADMVMTSDMTRCADHSVLIGSACPPAGPARLQEVRCISTALRKYPFVTDAPNGSS